MISNIKCLVLLGLVVIMSHSFTDAAETNTGLGISSDESNTNLQTSISRLHGNVILKHFDLVIKGDDAEIKAANENHPQQFIISGEPVKFKQESDVFNLSATAEQLVYIPSNELMELQGNVSIMQQTAENSFELDANELKMIFKKGNPFQFNAKGSPVIFTHQLANRKISINAEQVNWQESSQKAILLVATVVDKQTSFTADKIEYNALTGEIIASGNGSTRPSYRYDASKEVTKDKVLKKDSNKFNDS